MPPVVWLPLLAIRVALVTFKKNLMNSVRSDLLAFINSRVGQLDGSLNNSSPVEQSLGIAELDTIVFYNDFVKHFSINTPEKWDISNHVSPVGLYSWKHYFKRLLSKKYRQKTMYKDLTIGELEAIIVSNFWNV